MNWNRVAFAVFFLSSFLFLREVVLTWNYTVRTIQARPRFHSASSSLWSGSFRQGNGPSVKKEYDSKPAPKKGNRSEGKQDEALLNVSVQTANGNSNATAGANKRKPNAYERKVQRRKEQREVFLDLIRKQQNVELSQESADTRYVVYYPVEAGFGNVISVMVEAILVSFITRRRFYSGAQCFSLSVVYNYPIFTHYFDLPFDHFIYPNSCCIIIECSHLAFLKEENIILKDSCRFLESDILNCTKKFIVYSTTCNMIDYLTYSDVFYSFFYEHGFVVDEKGDISAQIRKYLLNFLYTEVVSVKPFVREYVLQNKNRLRWDEYYVIGMQIRSGFTNVDNYPYYFLNREDVDYFIVRAKELTEQARKKQSKPVKWFVSCDSQQLKSELVRRNPDMMLSSDCFISHSLSDMYSDHRTNGMLCTLIDGYLLGSTDVALITGRSTYGIWATNLNMHLKRIQVLKGSWKEYLRKQKS